MKLSEYFRYLRLVIKEDGWLLTRISGSEWCLKKPLSGGGYDYNSIIGVVKRRMSNDGLRLYDNAELYNDILYSIRFSSCSNSRQKLINRVYGKLLATQYRKQPC